MISSFLLSFFLFSSFFFVLLFLPLLFLTLQLYVSFCLLHQVIPGVSIFADLAPVSQF